MGKLLKYLKVTAVICAVMDSMQSFITASLKKVWRYKNGR
ncbi:hypothetical protein SAMN05443428_10314 [Caloramator quimbayensis]|uniref:Uncharacterized protein n=1 Tax=Caloramator quimbayensis TaxID=1147123 RepID=A0A1T4WQ01_9CLOT|nr:hypothetical protein SAMN05443428_10314 [Caloramator quimbayensis]